MTEHFRNGERAFMREYGRRTWDKWIAGKVKFWPIFLAFVAVLSTWFNMQADIKSTKQNLSDVQSIVKLNTESIRVLKNIVSLHEQSIVTQADGQREMRNDIKVILRQTK